MTISLKQLEKPIGVVLYQGPSMLDRKPIVAIATGFQNSENPKTGAMIQVWILRSDMKPTEAYSGGHDVSVCGNCIHREARTCYVNVFQAPYSVHKAWKAGRYSSTVDLELFRGRAIRLGAYGDPAAVPIKVWESVCSVVSGWTGYTHQWRSCDQSLKRFTMASCETVAEMGRAKSKGWRTFRILAKWEKPGPREFMCPASEAAGKRLTCVRCRACKGGEFTGQATPVIYAHGGGLAQVKATRFNRIRQRKDQKHGWRDLVPVC